MCVFPLTCLSPYSELLLETSGNLTLLQKSLIVVHFVSSVDLFTMQKGPKTYKTYPQPNHQRKISKVSCLDAVVAYCAYDLILTTVRIK